MDSCNLIVYLKKAKLTLAGNHLMTTNFLTSWFYFTNLTEDLTALSCVRSGCLAIGTPDRQKLCQYSSLANMMSNMCTINIRHPVLLSDKLFSLL